MRFIHAADIHLDSPLTGLSAYGDAPASALRTATRDAFANLVDEAIAEQVDFMVVAGDLYDGNWRDFNTGLFFVGQMGRLNKAGIPVYLLLGNHDAESEMTRRLELPANVHRFPSNGAATFQLPALRVALHGRSFRVAATTENLAVGYPDPVPGWFNIGVLHTALEGNTAHANYAPCSIAELEARGYQYWALGHVHEHRVWRGGCTIAFPGNLQGRHARETGPRGALMVTADGGEVCSVERLIVDVMRWESVEVDVSASITLADAARAAGDRLDALAAEVDPSRPLAVRITLTGASPAHGELFGLESQLRAELLARAAAIGEDRLWIEKVRIDTTPHAPAGQIASRSDAVADLAALLSQADSDEAFVESLREDLMQLVGKAPIELLGAGPAAVPVLEDVRAGRVRELIRATAPSLVARIARAD